MKYGTYIDELLQVLSAEVEARESSKGRKVDDSRFFNPLTHMSTTSAIVTKDTGNLCVL